MKFKFFLLILKINKMNFLIFCNKKDTMNNKYNNLFIYI